MEKLSELTVGAFLEKISSSEPAPGGGSVAALACALGASLLQMAAAVSAGKKDFSPELISLGEEARILKETSMSLMEEDAGAYLRVVQAYRLPRETPEEKKERKEAVDRALLEATMVPGRTSEAALEILRLARKGALLIGSAVFCDLAVGAVMAMAGLEGGLFNVAINLQGSKNTKLIEKASTSRDAILKEAREILDELKPLLDEKLGLSL
jgi:formiminotetrahydrofolate cyclodeaminase